MLYSNILSSLARMSVTFFWNSISTVFVVLILALSVQTYVSYRRLQHIPGPWNVGVTPLWLAYHTLKCDVYLAVEDLTKQYGDFVRIAPNIVVTADPELYRITESPRAPFVRGQWYKGMKFDPRIDNIVSMTDEKAHAQLRAKMMPGARKDVTTLESDIDSQILWLLDLIEVTYIARGKSFDFAVLASYFTLDVLSKIAFGSVFGFMVLNRDMFEYHKTIAAFLPIAELSQNVPIVLKLLNSRIVQKLAGPKPSDKVGLGAIMGKAHGIVAQRFEPSAIPERPDMLASFVKNGLSQIECESESVIQIMAGSDSTATALRITLWHILCSPPAYTRLMDEIKNAVASGNVSHPIITDAESKSLPYLQACIREGLRIFMPLQGLITKTCPAPGYWWKGFSIPAGTQIGTSLYAMHRRKDIYGSDADVFRPERFIEGPPEKIKELERTQELVFAYGRHGCLGKGIALMEIGKVIFELLRRFELVVVNPLNAVESKSSGVVLQKGMLIRAWNRQSL